MIRAGYDLIDTFHDNEVIMTDVMAKDIAERLGVALKAIYNASSRQTRVMGRYAIRAKYDTKKEPYPYAHFTTDDVKGFGKKWYIACNRIARAYGKELAWTLVAVNGTNGTEYVGRYKDAVKI